MKSRNGKLPFNKTSFYRIARKRLAVKLPMAASIIAEGLSRIQILQSQDINPHIKMAKAAMIASEAINTFKNAAEAMNTLKNAAKVIG